jgi:hypothetical protein
MIFKDSEAANRPCPLRQFSHCMGCDCPVWRWKDHERGYCGFGGDAAERPAAPVEPKIEQPVPELVTRPVHGVSKRKR